MKKQYQRAFTIVEVLIVIAIAALIMLLVFLAVAGLQRNYRNSQRRADVHKMFVGLDTTRSNTPRGSTISSCTGNQVSCWINGYQLSQYDSSSVNVYWIMTTGPRGCLSGCVPVPTTIDQLYIYNWLKCTNGAADWNEPGINDGSIVALYFVETSGGISQQCSTFNTSYHIYNASVGS